MTKDHMYEFMTARLLCVVATLNADNGPEAAIVAFSPTKKFEILIGTSSKSRKYANIVQNPYVAITIGDEEGEVQYEGRAERLPFDEYDNIVAEDVARALPGAAKHRNDPNEVYFKITPSWIRFIIHGSEGGEEEFTFDGEEI